MAQLQVVESYRPATERIDDHLGEDILCVHTRVVAWKFVDVLVRSPNQVPFIGESVRPLTQDDGAVCVS
jgi:hypothetical protein